MINCCRTYPFAVCRQGWMLLLFSFVMWVSRISHSMAGSRKKSHSQAELMGWEMSLCVHGHGSSARRALTSCFGYFNYSPRKEKKPSRQLFARVQNPHMIVHPRVEQQAQTKRKKDIIFNEVFALFMSWRGIYLPVLSYILSEQPHCIWVMFLLSYSSLFALLICTMKFSAALFYFFFQQFSDSDRFFCAAFRFVSDDVAPWQSRSFFLWAYILIWLPQKNREFQVNFFFIPSTSGRAKLSVDVGQPR